jgi:hypothetical protein
MHYLKRIVGKIMNTALDKIVEVMMLSEGKVAVISSEYSPERIAIKLLEVDSGVDISLMESKEQVKDFIIENHEKLGGLVTFPNGDSRFIALNTANHSALEVQTLTLTKLLEGDIKVVITEPNLILFRESVDYKTDSEGWNIFKSAMKSMLGVEFIIAQDDMGLRVINR